MVCALSSRCHGLVCRICLYHFLVVLAVSFSTPRYEIYDVLLQNILKICTAACSLIRWNGFTSIQCLFSVLIHHIIIQYYSCVFYIFSTWNEVSSAVCPFACPSYCYWLYLNMIHHFISSDAVAIVWRTCIRLSNSKYRLLREYWIDVKIGINVLSHVTS